MIDRPSYLAGLWGQPYDPERANCWHLVVRLQRDLFGRDLPCGTPDLVEDARRRAEVLATHDERRGWRASEPVDGAIALMGRVRGRETHAGVVLVDEHGAWIWHTDDRHGVAADSPTELAAARFWRISYWIPADQP